MRVLQVLRHPIPSLLFAAVFHAWAPLCDAQDTPASTIRALPPVEVRALPASPSVPAAPATAMRPETPPEAVPAAPLAPAPSATASAAPTPRANQIALILPLAAPDYAPAGEAVLAGCRAAVERNGGRPLMVVHRTDASPEQIITAYDTAVARGSAVAVGPLTRSGVSALAVALAAAGAERPRIPVLALNAPEPGTPTRADFYNFGVSLESEARMAARAAHAEGLRKAVVVQTPGALARRLSQAFAEAWLSLGGRIVDVQDIGAGADAAAELAALRERLGRLDAEAVFLSTDARAARVARPYLPAALRVFAVSQINDGAERSADLDGVQFFDMPWLLQPDHPAVMVYARPERMPVSLQRFYALGIDACRIAAEMAGSTGAPRRALMLDGVTGQLLVRRDGGTVEREPMAATFLEGRIAVVEQGPAEGGAASAAAPASPPATTPAPRTPPSPSLLMAPRP